MIHWAGDRIKALGGSVEYADIGQQTLPDGSKIKYGKSTVSTKLFFLQISFFLVFPLSFWATSAMTPRRRPSCCTAT